MALHNSTQWNIAVKESVDSQTPTKKLAIQQRLESRTKSPPSTSKENLDLKQLQATEARTRILDEKKEKIVKREREFDERRKRLPEEYEKKIEDLKEVSTKKEEKATQSVKDSESLRVKVLAARNAKVIESGKKAVETLGEKNKSMHEKKTEVEEKAARTVKAKESVIVNHLAAYNAKVMESGAGALKGMEDKLEALKVEVGQKEGKAENAKENEIVSVIVQAATHNDLVKSRSELISATKTLQVECQRNETEIRTRTASHNRKVIMMAKQIDLARKNQEVHERGSAAKSSRETKEQLEQAERDARMMDSSVRREAILQDKVLKAKILASPNRSPEGSPAKEQGGLHNQLLSKEAIEQKLEEATVRRSAFIEQKVNKALSFSSPAPKSKGASPVKFTEESSAMDAINTKMDDAAARREMLLLHKAESAGMAVQKAKNIASAVKASPSKSSAANIGIDGTETSGKRFHTDEEGLEIGHEVRDIVNREEEAEVDAAVSVNDVSLEMRLGDEKPVNESQNEDLGGGKCTAA